MARSGPAAATPARPGCGRGRGWRCHRVSHPAPAGLAGERLADAGLPARGGQPKQHQRRDLGGVDQLIVTVELGGQPVERFGAAVVLEEEADLAVALAPAAVAVGADHLAPTVSAGPLRQPQRQPGGAVLVDQAEGGELLGDAPPARGSVSTRARTRTGVLARRRDRVVHAGGLRQESAAVNEPVTGAATCALTGVGGAGSEVGGRPGARPAAGPADRPARACSGRVRACMGSHSGNPVLGAGRADPDVAVEVVDARGRAVRPDGLPPFRWALSAGS